MHIYVVNSVEGSYTTLLTHNDNFTQYEFENMRAAIQVQMGNFVSYGELIEQLIHQYGFKRASTINV